MSLITVQVGEEGRIVIPAEIRQKLGIKVGDHIAISWSDDNHEWRIASRQQRLQHALDLVKQYASSSGSVVDELIRERRQAASDE